MKTADHETIPSFWGSNKGFSRMNWTDRELCRLRPKLTEMVGYYHLLYEREGLPELSPLDRMKFEVLHTAAAHEISVSMLRTATLSHGLSNIFFWPIRCA